MSQRVRQLLLNMKDAAHALGVSRWTLQDMVRAGFPVIVLPGTRLKRIDIRDIENWIAANRVRGGGALLRASDGRRSSLSFFAGHVSEMLRPGAA